MQYFTLYDTELSVCVKEMKDEVSVYIRVENVCMAFSQWYGKVIGTLKGN